MRNSGNFGLWNPESTALESGIQLMESGIPNRILKSGFQPLRESGIHGCGIRNPQTWNPKSTAWNPESNTLLDDLTWDDTVWEVAGSKPQRDQHSGSFNNWGENAAFNLWWHLQMVRLSSLRNIIFVGYTEPFKVSLWITVCGISWSNLQTWAAIQ